MTKATISPATRNGKIKRQWIEATINRADGTVENLGVIADTRPTWLLAQAGKRLATLLIRFFRRDH